MGVWLDRVHKQYVCCFPDFLKPEKSRKTVHHKNMKKIRICLFFITLFTACALSMCKKINVKGH